VLEVLEVLEVHLRQRQELEEVLAELEEELEVH
jgi:hypothetical protein